MASLHQLPLTMSNWRSVWLISVLLAHKFFDDKSLHLRGFVRFCPIFTLSELKMLERSALTLLSYSVAVKPSLYVKYYFELRQLFSEISGPSSGIWTLEALTLCQSRKLETRSLLAEKSAQTYEDATRTDRTPYLIRPCPWGLARSCISPLEKVLDYGILFYVCGKITCHIYFIDLLPLVDAVSQYVLFLILSYMQSYFPDVCFLCLYFFLIFVQQAIYILMLLFFIT